jgi:hypothetical protein
MLLDKRGERFLPLCVPAGCRRIGRGCFRRLAGGVAVPRLLPIELRHLQTP